MTDTVDNVDAVAAYFSQLKSDVDDAMAHIKKAFAEFKQAMEEALAYIQYIWDGYRISRKEYKGLSGKIRYKVAMFVNDLKYMKQKAIFKHKRIRFRIEYR